MPVLQAFDAVVEASGSSHGIKLASAMTRPMGSIVLKSTCSAVSDASMPAWSDIANDVVVNEEALTRLQVWPAYSASVPVWHSCEAALT